MKRKKNNINNRKYYNVKLGLTIITALIAISHLFVQYHLLIPKYVYTF